MNIDTALAQVRPVTRILGIICISLAAAKLAGLGISVRGSVADLSLVGIGLMHI